MSTVHFIIPYCALSAKEDPMQDSILRGNDHLLLGRVVVAPPSMSALKETALFLLIGEPTTEYRRGAVASVIVKTTEEDKSGDIFEVFFHS